MQPRVYLTSDTHFYHKNILNLEPNRKVLGETVEEMNQSLIERWNSVVRKDDLVIHLGDVSFGNKEKTLAIMCKLKGRKFLVMGNHDTSRTVTWFKNVGFEGVSKDPVDYGDTVLSHEPLGRFRHNQINLHGHIHSRNMLSSAYKNVGVDVSDYTPILSNLSEDIVEAFQDGR